MKRRNLIRKILAKRKGHLADDVLNLLHPRSWLPWTGQVPPSLVYSAYINLDARIDRKLNIENQFQKLSCLPNRIAGELIHSEQDFCRRFASLASKIRSQFMNSNPNGALGYLGCYISHLRALESCPDGHGFSLICEDDLFVLSRNLNNWIGSFLDLPFDILLLDPQGAYKKTDRLARNVYRITEGSPTYWGTHAYVIKNKSKSLILDELDKLPLDSVDHSLMDLRGILNIYAVRTTMCWPKGSWGSDMIR